MNPITRANLEIAVLSLLIFVILFCSYCIVRACDPWDPVYTVTPTIGWDEVPDAWGYDIYYRPVGGVDWLLYVSLENWPLCIDYDQLPPYDCNTTDPHGGHWGADHWVALQRYDTGFMMPMAGYEFAVKTWNDAGDSVNFSNTVYICWYPECPCDVGGCAPPSCCDQLGPQELCY